MVGDEDMESAEFEKTFYDNGFVVLKDCIDPRILDEGKAVLSDVISGRLGRKVDFKAGFVELLESATQFSLQQSLYDELKYRDFPLKVLRSPEVIEKLICLLGPDLSYGENAEILVNIKEAKGDYYVKKWHQEFWSGVGIHSVAFWFPISIAEDSGGMEFIPGSHHWGHIPHRNREPLEIPDGAEVVRPQILEGDGVMFHSLTVHGTVANEAPYPRFALPLIVKNFYYPDSGMPEFGTWRPFNFSPLAMIHKKLGNPAFSPFRTLGSTRTDTGIADLSKASETGYK